MAGWQHAGKRRSIYTPDPSQALHICTHIAVSIAEFKALPVPFAIVTYN